MGAVGYIGRAERVVEGPEDENPRKSEVEPAAEEAGRARRRYTVERRRAPRVRCAVPCEVRLRGKRSEGRVRNVSEGGLALEAALAAPGDADALAIRLQPPGRDPIEIVALVWHVRAARREGAPSQLGLVLSQAGDDYFQWLASLLRPERPAAPRAKPSPPAIRQRFAVRLAQPGNPRARRVLVVAPDADGASARALAEVGPGWAVVGVETLRAPG